MFSIKIYQDQLLPAQEQLQKAPGENTPVILVFKQYRFHKQLSVELYAVATTKNGRLKNPLTPVNPLDLSLQTSDSRQLRFYTAVSRFQNNPTAAKSPADIDALKEIFKNPLALRFFYHNPDFSESIVAASVVEIHHDETLADVLITVFRRESHFDIVPSVAITGKKYRFEQVQFRYEFFVHVGKQFHLLNGFHLLKLCRFFQFQQPVVQVPVTGFDGFKTAVLDKLEERIKIIYHDLQPGTRKQLKEANLLETPERLIYLSDLDPYVMIIPVMRYGNIEIPIRTKRQIYARDASGNLFTVERNDKAEIAFMAILLQQHPHFTEQLENDLNHFYLHKQRLLDENWFLEAFEQWRKEHITILGFNQLKGNKLNAHKPAVNIHVISGLDWFNTKIDVRFGKTRASLKQIHQSVRNQTKFVHLDDGTVGILPESWLKKFDAYFKNSAISKDVLITHKSDYTSLRDKYDDKELSDEVKQEIKELEKRFSSLETIDKAVVPAGLRAELRDYQKQGLQWLNLLDQFNFGGCLADDMGLGKTIQIIAFILGQRERSLQNTNLVVVPTSLLFNWQNEIRQFAPSLSVFTLYGPDRQKDVAGFNNHDVILTTYGTVLSDISYLKTYSFNYIFLDESQNIKNINSQRYLAVRQLQARNRVAITGTPVENNTLDLYAQLSFACPGLLGSRQSFRDLFSIPIDKFKSSRNALELQRKVAPFVLRRTKKDVATELPEKTEMTVYCPMGDAQRKIYQAYEREFRDYISGITEDELAKSAVHILKGLTRLRQICNSPLLLEDEKLYDDRSSKLDTLMEHIENNSPGHKILVFSQFVSMLNLIRAGLESKNIPYAYLTGATRNREQEVNRFQQDPSVRVFLVSLKAGGTGLNLTEADYVYLVDPWWNPAVENQAIDRSYRIGQKKNVVAVRLICPDTLEEKIVKLQESKKDLSEHLIKTESGLLRTLNKDAWLTLLDSAASSYDDNITVEGC